MDLWVEGSGGEGVHAGISQNKNSRALFCLKRLNV